jgi:hypothetical protein
VNNAASEKSSTQNCLEGGAWAARRPAHAFSKHAERHAFSSKQGNLPLFHGADAEHVALCVLTQCDPAELSD